MIASPPPSVMTPEIEEKMKNLKAIESELKVVEQIYQLIIEANSINIVRETLPQQLESCGQLQRQVFGILDKANDLCKMTYRAGSIAGKTSELLLKINQWGDRVLASPASSSSSKAETEKASKDMKEGLLKVDELRDFLKSMVEKQIVHQYQLYQQQHPSGSAAASAKGALTLPTPKDLALKTKSSLEAPPSEEDLKTKVFLTLDDERPSVYHQALLDLDEMFKEYEQMFPNLSSSSTPSLALTPPSSASSSSSSPSSSPATVAPAAGAQTVASAAAVLGKDAKDTTKGGIVASGEAIVQNTLYPKLPIHQVLSSQDLELRKMAQELDHQLNPHNLRFTLTKPVLQLDPFSSILPHFHDTSSSSSSSSSEVDSKSSSAADASKDADASEASSNTSSPETHGTTKDAASTAASSAELDQTILMLMGLLDDDADKEGGSSDTGPRHETDVQVAIRKFFKWLIEIQNSGLSPSFLSSTLSSSQATKTHKTLKKKKKNVDCDPFADGGVGDDAVMYGTTMKRG